MINTFFRWRGLVLLSAFVFLTACGDDDVDGEALCGNGVVEEAEECDDGNAVSGDGCSAECRIEDGPITPGVCDDAEDGEECGDGLVCLSGECIAPGCLTDDDCTNENVCVADGVCDLSTYECVDDEIRVGEECGEGMVCDDEIGRASCRERGWVEVETGVFSPKIVKLHAL